MLELLDNFFRYGAIASCLFTAALVLRDAACRLPARLAAFCSITAAAYLFSSLPGLGETIGTGMIPVLLISLFGPTAVWVFGLSMFDDNFKLRRAHYSVIAVFYLLGAVQFISFYQMFGNLPLLSSSRLQMALKDSGSLLWGVGLLMLFLKVGMSLQLLWVAWNGRHDDLVPKRRRFREVFVGAVVMISFGIVITENWLLGFAPYTANMLLVAQSASIFLVTLYMLWHITSVDGEWLFGNYEQPLAPEQPYIESEDRHDLETLNALAESGALMAPGITVSKLAQMAAMPEHRLRRLVNQHLGYRNFSDYLNFHRIEAAKNRLAVVSDRHVPVLTVAMDVGYGSLGPFNRAFKERAGMTPTQFRRKALGAA